MKKTYDDIIHLPHPASATRLRMPILDRAAQFAPFAALTGFEAAIRETARLTDMRVDLDEDVRAALSDRLQMIADRMEECPQVSITYFQPDERKAGGAYIVAVGTVKKIDEYERVVTMTDGKVIPIDEIIGIDGGIFEA